MSTHKIFLLVAVSFLSQWGCLSNINIDSKTYTVSDTLTMEKFNDFKAKVISSPIRTVVFKDCYGGNSLAGIRLAEEIKKYNIKTVVSGTAASACAYAYLGGVIRHVDDNSKDNLILFHGGFDLAGAPVGAIKNQEYLDLYSRVIGFKFSKIATDIILNTKKPLEGIYFVQMNIDGGARYFTSYCDGNSEPVYEKCQKLEGITLVSEGIITK